VEVTAVALLSQRLKEKLHFIQMQQSGVESQDLRKFNFRKREALLKIAVLL